MALRDFLFGFKFLATDYVSPVLKNIEGRIEAVNAQVKNTARWREAGTNLAIAGGAFAAAGGAVALALRSTVNAAAEMQSVMTHVATAMNDGTATQMHLAQAQEMSERLAIASGLAAKQEASAYYIARSNMLDHAQAMAAVDVATKLTIGTTASLADAQAQLEPTTRLLTTVFQNFGSKIGDPNKQIAGFADTMAKLQTQKAFRDIGEVNEAMSYAVPLAKSAGIAFNDMSAALATLSLSGKHGAEAGTAFSELVQKLSTEPKLRGLVAHTAQGGVDLVKTIDKLHAVTAGYTPIQEAMYLHQLGFTERSIVGVSLLIDKTQQYHDTIDDLNNSQGANAAAFATRQASMEIATGRLSAAWDVFTSKIGEQLLGPATAVVTKLTQAVSWMVDFSKTHTQIVKFVATFAAIGAAAAIVVGGAIALISGMLVLGSFAPALAAWILPIVGITAAIAGAGAAMMTWKGRILDLLFAWPSHAFWKNLGMNIVKGIGEGIEASALGVLGPIGAVAKLIMDHFPHSPARLGPLRTLHQIRIVEEIAQSIKPGPALTAIRRTAAAMAIAAPVMLSMATPALAVSTATNAGSARANMVAPRFGAAGGGVTIQVHQEIHIDGAIAGDERKLMAVLSHHGEELAKIIDARVTHRNRGEF